MNKTLKIVLIIVISIIIIVIVRNLCVLYVSNIYNDLVDQDVKIKTAWSQVESQYKCRIDIIKTISNNLNNSIKNTDKQMQAVVSTADSLSKITVEPKDSLSMSSYVTAQEKMIEHARLAINVVHEAYPELKSDRLLEEMKLQLEGYDNRICSCLKAYNEAISIFDSTIQKFPKSVIAKMFGFTYYPIISIPQEENLNLM